MGEINKYLIIVGKYGIHGINHPVVVYSLCTDPDFAASVSR